MQRLIFVTIDPSLGRLDYDSLSDQARMEIFVSLMSQSAQEKFQDANGNFLDVCEWYGVECDAEGNVKEFRIIIWEEDENGPNLDYIPPHVRFFSLNGSKVCNLNPVMLPLTLVEFKIGGTTFRNGIDLKDFARSNLEELKMEKCGLQGTCDTSQLPESLMMLNLTANKLHGSLVLDCLPRRMTVFLASANNFGGKLLIDNLPPDMSKIHVMQNKFTEFALLSTPAGTKNTGTLHMLQGYFLEIEAGDNEIKGTVVVEKAMNGKNVKLTLCWNYIEAVVDEKGKKHRFSKRILQNQNILMK